MGIFVTVRPEESKTRNLEFPAQSRPSAEIHHGVGTNIHHESSLIRTLDAPRSAPFANDQEGVTRVTLRTPEVTVQASQSQQLNMIHTLE